MNGSKLLAACILLTLIAHALGVRAFETDQYNLPPTPLADIGDEVSEYVEQSLRSAVARVNSDISASVQCLEMARTKTSGCSSAEIERKKLAYSRSNEAVALEFFKLTGDGNLFTSKFGNWMRAHKFRGQPDRYKADYSESIYILNPANYLTISPTVRLFGTEFGIDKLEHFFQQGYKYYRIEKEAAAKGVQPENAAKKAIRWGQRTERTYYGLLASGVYSNADLYANYAGMKFYQALTKPLQINQKTRPAMLTLREGSWTVELETLRENLLKPFLTDHMNEAFNPSAFRPTLVRSVRRAVKKYACPDWRSAYPDLTAAAMNTRSAALNNWYGEDYGWKKRTHTVNLADLCSSQG